MTCKITPYVVAYVVTQFFLIEKRASDRRSDNSYELRKVSVRRIPTVMAHESKLLVVALGNPGTEYVHTRHNVGWMIADELCTKIGCSMEPAHDLYHSATFRYAGCQFTVIKPTTYMNLSGKAAKAATKKLGIASPQVIVVVDEFNFPTGKVHLKLGGSDGGHNGLSSMISELGTPTFWRMRCGISRNFGPGQLVDYVLSNFPKEEEHLVTTMRQNGAEGLLLCAKLGFPMAMQRINV
jgi:peptidyl-tRNA hydrolase, PTH1 family